MKKSEPAEDSRPKQYSNYEHPAKQSNDDRNSANDEGFCVPSLPGIDARDGTSSTRALSELGNAQRMEDRHEGDIYFVFDIKTWIYWNGAAWIWDLDGAFIRSSVAGLVDQIYDEGRSQLQDAEHFARHARKSQTARHIESTVTLLKDRDCVRLPMNLIDADIFCVGIDGAKQLVDLRSGKVRTATYNDLVTKSLNVNYLGDPAKCTRWLAFLTQVFEGDTDLIDWLWRWCGYLLTGSTREQIFVFCYGFGANGKSVMADLLRFIMGDYGRVIASETLTESKRQAGGAAPDLYDLIGARVVQCSETESDGALAESLVKDLVSADSLTVRKLYGNPVQFTPYLKLMILGNHRPIIRGNDYGIWRRVRMIPFKRVFGPHERNPNLLDELKSEAPHIFAWMVEGCLQWQARGLSDTPEAIRSATGDYQAEQDLIGQWLSECCQSAPSKETTASDLYASYKNWAIDNGLRPASNVALGRKLSERGYSSRQSNGKRWLSGLIINSNYNHDIY